MADLTITAANISIESSDVKTIAAVFGETVAEGEMVHLDGDGKWYLAEADNDDLHAGSRGSGFTLFGGVLDGNGFVANGCGTIDAGATLTIGTTYIISETAGGIAPASDWSGYTAGSRMTIVGIAVATDELLLLPNPIVATA